MSATIYIGQDARYRLTALNDAGGAANPAGVRFRVKDPDGTVTVYTLGSSSAVAETTAGQVYTLTFDAGIAGKWTVRAETLNVGGNVVGVDEASLLVIASNVV